VDEETHVSPTGTENPGSSVAAMPVTGPEAVSEVEQEVLAMARIKAFCASILKTLAPPLLREIEASKRLRAEAEPFTPMRVTRQASTRGGPSHSKPVKKASAAETVLLKALGITPTELAVNEEDLLTFRKLFDSPLREQHLRVIASIFGKMVPTSFPSLEACRVEGQAQ
jgi:hypothetical protein